MEPWNSVSPTKTQSSPTREMPPFECPGVCSTRSTILPKRMASPSLSVLSAGSEATCIPNMLVQLCPVLVSIGASSSWMRIGAPVAFFSMPFPLTWSPCPWVLIMYLTFRRLVSMMCSTVFLPSFSVEKPGSITTASFVSSHQTT